MRWKKTAAFGSMLVAISTVAALVTPTGARAATGSGDGCGHESLKTFKLTIRAEGESYAPGGLVDVSATVTRRVKQQRGEGRSADLPQGDAGAPVEDAIVAVSLRRGSTFIFTNALTDESGHAWLQLELPARMGLGAMKATGYAWRETAKGSCLYEVSNFVTRRNFIEVRRG